MKITKMFKVPNHIQVAEQELQEAQRDLLKWQSALEYSAAMVDYNQERIKRLHQVSGKSVLRNE